MRILNAEPEGYSEEARAILRQLGDLDEVALDRAGLLERVADYDVLIVRLAHTVDGEVFENAPRLSAVVTATTGLDHIDLEAAAAHGVAVLSLRGEHSFLSTVSSTAELTWTLLLALVRKLVPAVEHVREGQWDRDRFRGLELQGKRLGIVGVGRVGAMVARYGLAFGMEVKAFDPAPRVWPENVEQVSDLESLAGSVDVLSVHAPLDSSTEGLVSRDVLIRLKRGSYVINTARSALVDNRAVLELLETGQLAGAAIDVLDEERDHSRRQGHPLLDYARTHDNLLITPHIGGASVEAMARTEVFMAGKLRAHLDGVGERGQR